MASGSSDRTIKLWDAETGQELRTLKGDLYVESVVFSPDGRRLAAGGGTLKLWDAESGREIRTFNGHKGGVWSVAFSPDGRRIVSSGLDATIKLWDSETGQELSTLKGHAGGVRGVVFSPDGNRIVSASNDGTLKVWDAQTGQELRTLRGHTDGVTSLAFSPDGRRIASGNAHGLKLWDAELLDEQSRYARLLAREALEEEWDAGRAQALIEQKTNLSLALKQAAIDRLARSSDPRVLAKVAQRRADVEAQRGQWGAAAENFQVASELAPDGGRSALSASLALAALAAGDNASYRRACARLWDRDQDSDDQSTLLDIVMICSAGPEALPDMGPLVDAFEAMRGRSFSYGLVVTAMAIHYRAHQLDQVTKLQRTAEIGYLVVKRTPDFAADEWLRVPQTLFVAMAYQQLEKDDEAKKYLKIAQQAHDELTARPIDAAAETASGSVLNLNTWQRRAMLAQLRREAEALVAKTDGGQ
jgi:hypothetical protein